jgi:GH15 family glucan-1,4-alpha-glucosidase
MLFVFFKNDFAFLYKYTQINTIMDNLDYGIIGNCQSAALVSKNGSIDWCCLPRFDSPSTFGALLDEKIGGSWQIDVQGLLSSYQHYDHNTCILITGFITAGGQFELHDFMPRYDTEDGAAYLSPDVIRYFKYIRGNVSFRVYFDPKLEYAAPKTIIKIKDEFLKAYTTEGEYDSVYLYSDLSLKNIANHEWITLTSDSFMLMSYNQKLLIQNINRIYLKLQRTRLFWLDWADKTTDFKMYSKEIIRSALTLKLLSYHKSGAVLAALTTSLPETIGEVRNWDYRFCWIRDASMVIKIEAKLGHNKITHDYLKFIIGLLPDKGQKMQIMYGIDGEKNLVEQELNHLSGYKNSKPVRIGNAAFEQKQNDIYGILMDVIYQYFELYSTSLGLSEDLWTIVRGIVRVVEENWQLPDKGIWEIRSEDRHFTFSKVLCWVAIDRAVKIATLLNQDDYVKTWDSLAHEIKEDIFINAWSEKEQAYAQSYGSDDMDASVLLMEDYGFIEASDERFKKTVLVIQEQLEVDGLLFRYRNQDDFGTPNSAFTICTFWLINALYKIGHKKEAIAKFKKLRSYSNHLGLFSEDLDFKTKRLLGNFPQAYSHLALIETAITLGGDELSEEEQFLSQLL